MGINGNIKMREESMNQKTENEYRQINLNSSSSLKVFSDNKRKYYKQFVLNEKFEDDDEVDNKSVNIGRLVETLLLESSKFDEKFFLSSCAKAPTNLMLNFVNALYRHTVNCMTDDGEITRDFEALAMDAYNDSGFKIKFDAVIAKFIGSDAEIFYGEMLQVKIKGLTVVTTLDVTMAEKIVEQLKTSFVTKDIVNLIDSERFSVLTQYQIENFEIDGLPLKAMMDKIIIDHVTKEIKVFDLKVSWSPEWFMSEYFIKRRSYIQAYVYHKACLSLTQNKKSEFYGYSVTPIKFIVADSGAFYSPLIYSLSMEDLNKCYNGFTYRGRCFDGVKTIIDDLKFCLDYNIWDISKKSYYNSGILLLDFDN